jgi:hypothetical protein
MRRRSCLSLARANHHMRHTVIRTNRLMHAPSICTISNTPHICYLHCDHCYSRISRPSPSPRPLVPPTHPSISKQSQALRHCFSCSALLVGECADELLVEIALCSKTLRHYWAAVHCLRGSMCCLIRRLVRATLSACQLGGVPATFFVQRFSRILRPSLVLTAHSTSGSEVGVECESQKGVVMARV